MPLCVIADALYPNQTFFRIGAQSHWQWIVTFKDGNLPSVWEEVLGLQSLSTDQERQEIGQRQGHTIHRHYRWINAIVYVAFQVRWFECVETLKAYLLWVKLLIDQ